MIYKSMIDGIPDFYFRFRVLRALRMNYVFRHTNGNVYACSVAPRRTLFGSKYKLQRDLLYCDVIELGDDSILFGTDFINIHVILTAMEVARK